MHVIAAMAQNVPRVNKHAQRTAPHRALLWLHSTIHCCDGQKANQTNNSEKRRKPSFQTWTHTYAHIHTRSLDPPSPPCYCCSALRTYSVPGRENLRTSRRRRFGGLRVVAVRRSQTATNGRPWPFSRTCSNDRFDWSKIVKSCIQFID